MFDSLSISGSGLTANRLWLDTISNNIANMNSTGRPGSDENSVYRRQVPVFSQVLERKLNENPANSTQESKGVTVAQVLHSEDEPRMVHNPSHPHANEDGYVAYPNINITNEIANMMTATRAYQANATSLQSSKDIVKAALQMGRGQ